MVVTVGVVVEVGAILREAVLDDTKVEPNDMSEPIDCLGGCCSLEGLRVRARGESAASDGLSANT
jgi:hypothetical protein